MQCGLIGLPAVGKTTLFNALTGSAIPVFAGGGGASPAAKPNVGVARIPDPRLDVIASFIATKKIVPATIQFVDIPGLPIGGGAQKANQFLSHVREVDALAHIVRCFDHGAAPQPGRDIQALETELILADLQVVETAQDKAARIARSGDAEAKARLAVLEKAGAALNEGRPIRSAGKGWSPSEAAILKSYGMITAKPVLYIANMGEADLGPESPAAREVLAGAAAAGSECVTVCAKLEAELAELQEPDRSELLRSMGLEEPAIGPLARAAYRVLGLASFYTAGEKEVRAWTIPIGAPAPAAAGVIHSDIERGFIRAECFHIDDLVKHRSEKAIKEAGRLRSEGRSYAMQDGDVVHFLFNV
jgi:hypothetical protein